VITGLDIDQVDTSIPHIPYFAVTVAGVYGTERQAEATLVSQHIRFILWGRDALTWKNIAVGRPSFERRHLRLVYRDANALLFERVSS
jgi:hypothetical protein